MAEKHEAELLEDFSRIIKLYSDGSVVRGDDYSFFSHSPDNDKYESLDFKYKHVEYKDVVLDEEVGLWMASEHRVPCAYDNSVAALHWLQLQALAAEGAEPWLHSHADFSRVFIAGESAGGNIAHHVGVWECGRGRQRRR
ncbi:hypothetical protein SUGI_0987030 [Cryptomeria japonica]|nr:hypothetical protein SUGI_0987030 [Cryptomeria japonica]